MDAVRNETIIQTFLAIVLLAVIALLASSPRFLRLRRSRPITLLISGGWLAVGAGAIVGPSGLGVVDQDQMLRLTPLIMIGLGWIGVMIGLQADRALLRRLPGLLWGLVATDAIVSAVLVGVVAAAGLSLWVVEDEGFSGSAWIAPGIVLLASCAIGWSMETRSLQRKDAPESEQLAMLIRGGGSLGAIVAIILFGVGSNIAMRDEQSAMVFAPLAGAIRIGLAVAMALVLGFLGRYALRLAGRSRSELLVVFLGLVSLLAGVSADLGFSPLLASLLVGVVIANLAGSEIRQFNRFILEAEHVVGILFALLAGVLIDTRIGLGGLALATAIAGIRLITKPLILRAAARRFTPRPSASKSKPPESKRERLGSAMLSVAPVRQGPLAIALAVGLVLMEPSRFSQGLLTIVIISGLLSELLPLLLSSLTSRSPDAAETEAAAEPLSEQEDASK